MFYGVTSTRVNNKKLFKIQCYYNREKLSIITTQGIHYLTQLRASCFILTSMQTRLMSELLLLILKYKSLIL